MPPSISREICMNFRLDISRLCKHEFNKFRCGKTCSAITYCSYFAFFLVFFDVGAGHFTYVISSQFRKTANFSDGLKALFETFVLDSEEQIVD